MLKSLKKFSFIRSQFDEIYYLYVNAYVKIKIT